MRTTTHDLHLKVTALETKVDIMENEIEINRNFKHATNGVLHSQNGKIDVIVNQQNHTAEAIEKLTLIVEEGMKKIAHIINIKFMLVGGAAIGSVMIGGVIFMLKIYLNYYKK